MVAVPIKREYGPTLGRILTPRWRAASALTRRALIGSALAFVVLVLAAVLTFENAKYSHGGSVPFGFSYRSLYRAPAGPGEYVKVDRRSPRGVLEDSFAVGPLRLPPYSGGLTGELPLYAAAYIGEIRTRYRDFVLRGEGKTRVTTVPGYDVFYTTTVEGRLMYGRDVLLLPERPGAREGVDIVMLRSPTEIPQLDTPLEVGSAEVLSRPLKTLSFG